MLTLISQNTETWIQSEITQQLRTSFLWKLEFSYAVLNKLRGFLTLVLSDTMTQADAHHASMSVPLCCGCKL